MQGLYSIVSGLCLLLMFVLYLRMVTAVVRSEKRDIYLSIMIVGMVYLVTDVLWGVIYDNLLPIPVPIQRVIYSVFYATSAVIGHRWFVYVEYMQESLFYKNSVVRKLSYLPMIFVAFLFPGLSPQQLHPAKYTTREDAVGHDPYENIFTKLKFSPSNGY